MGRKCRTCPRHYLTQESRTDSVDQEILFSESALLATGVGNKGCYFPPFVHALRVKCLRGDGYRTETKWSSFFSIRFIFSCNTELFTYQVFT